MVHGVVGGSSIAVRVSEFHVASSTTTLSLPAVVEKETFSEFSIERPLIAVILKSCSKIDSKA